MISPLEPGLAIYIDISQCHVYPTWSWLIRRPCPTQGGARHGRKKILPLFTTATMASEQKQQQVYGFCSSSSSLFSRFQKGRSTGLSLRFWVCPSFGAVLFCCREMFFLLLFFFFFLSVSEGTLGTFFAPILGPFQKRRLALFRGHLAPVSSFTAMLFCCLGGYVFATVVRSTTAIYFYRPESVGAGAMVLVRSSSKT